MDFLLILTFCFTVISTALLFLLFLKNQKTENNSSIIEIINTNFITLLQENKQQQKDLQEIIHWFLERIQRQIRENLEIIAEKVDKKLQQWFEKTNETFGKIIERMAKIDQAQKNIEKLSADVVSLQTVLTDSKQKWIFGEVQLEHVVASVFGQGNKKLYEMQYHFAEEKVTVDCVIKTPQGLIPIDAKFPLLHRQRINEGKDDKEKATKDFKTSVKRQVDEIHTKYNIPQKTVGVAFMFIPAEAIFASIHSEYPDIVSYAHSHNVNIVSPTTLLAMLTIVLSAIQSIETQKQAHIIQEELSKLSTEFQRFTYRRGKFTKDLNTVTKDIGDIDTTSEKIVHKFQKIEKLELGNAEE